MAYVSEPQSLVGWLRGFKSVVRQNHHGRGRDRGRPLTSVAARKQREGERSREEGAGTKQSPRSLPVFHSTPTRPCFLFPSLPKLPWIGTWMTHPPVKYEPFVIQALPQGPSAAKLSFGGDILGSAPDGRSVGISRSCFPFLR